MPDVTGPAGDGVESSAGDRHGAPPRLLVCNGCEDLHGWPALGRQTYSVSSSSRTVGSGCDDDVEFRFALDIILDGLEHARDAG
jgi:hypothetical protein